MRNQTGMTLVEVMTVLVVLSVMCGIAGPVFEHLNGKMALRSEVSRLVSEFHKARAFAIQKNEYVVFHYTEEGYNLFVDDGSGGGTKGDWNFQSGEEMLAGIIFQNGVKIHSEESTFTSNRTRFTGRPGVKAGSVVLIGKDGNKAKVVVNSIGRVRVEKLI